MKKIIIASVLTIIAIIAPAVSSAANVPSACSGVPFIRNLTIGSVGQDVKCLQAILNTSASTQIVASGIGSPGYETTTFGQKTLAAVQRWQITVGLTPASQIGSLSRAKLNAWLSQTATTQTSQTPNAQSQQNTQNVTTYSANTLYSSLSPRLAFITCNWYNRYGNVLFSQSSNGLLGPAATNGNYFVSTVLGGVTNTSYTGSLLAPSSCTIQFPAGASLYAGGFSTFTTYANSAGIGPVSVGNANVDFAQVGVATPNNYLASYAQKNNYCSTRAAVGDSIVVFGWPINSTNQTLNGTITGTSGYYDTTTITVPNGMQGSTAVSLTNGCIIGQINASGQIADEYQLSYLFGW